MRISVIGIGYVGMANAILLAQHNEVTVYDILKERIDKINKAEFPVKDSLAEEFLQSHKIRLKATENLETALKMAEYVVIATPTNYDPEKEYFDTSSVEQIIRYSRLYAPEASIIIKSTIPLGFTEHMRVQHAYDKIYFSPEFLREGRALYDNLYPSRIIVGGRDFYAEKFAALLKEAAAKKDVSVLMMEPTEAEAVKLFANTYLALRVAYFNELDTYAESKGLDVRKIIEGISLDPRIGNYYNNPSFGYGGYCLPKDSKQLLANYENVPNDLIRAVVNSNETRKTYIAERICSMGVKTVGIYRLVMKTASDNFRESSIQDIMDKLSKKGMNIIIFEPTIKEKNYKGIAVCNDYEKFVEQADIILANRWEERLEGIKHKVYSRDLYQRD